MADCPPGYRVRAARPAGTGRGLTPYDVRWVPWRTGKSLVRSVGGMPKLLALGLTLILALASVLGLGAPSGAAASTRSTPSTPSGLASSATTATEIQAYVDRFPTHSLAVGVLTDGDLTVDGYGTDASGAPVSQTTPFRIASLSKSFTAALVVLLAERGTLDLDAPLTDALPQFAMADERAGGITLRMLLAHTSGLGTGSARDFARPETDDAQSLLEDLRDETLGADPGSEHEYSNLGYALAAAAIEEVTGRPFDEALRIELLEPLGMTDTTSVTQCAAPVGGVGSGHTAIFEMALAHPEPQDFCYGSGGMISTVQDVATWLRFQAGDGTTESGVTLLTGADLEMMHTAQPGTENADGYGLGWSFATEGDAQLVEHGGALATWSSHMVFVRGADGRPTGAGAVVLTDTVGAPSILARSLAVQAAGFPAPEATSSVVSPNLVFRVLLAISVVAGVIGLVRARTWPVRRHGVWRVAGCAWPAALVLVCLAAPALLSWAAFGAVLDPITAWRWGVATLPEVIVLLAVTMLACVAVLITRRVAVSRASRPAHRVAA